MKALLSYISSLFATALTDQATTDVYVQTPVGLVLGTQSDPRFGNVESFLGIKYGEISELYFMCLLTPLIYIHTHLSILPNSICTTAICQVTAHEPSG